MTVYSVMVMTPMLQSVCQLSEPGSTSRSPSALSCTPLQAGFRHEATKPLTCAELAGLPVLYSQQHLAKLGSALLHETLACLSSFSCYLVGGSYSPP